MSAPAPLVTAGGLENTRLEVPSMGQRTRKPLADRLWEKVDRNGPIPTARPDLGPCWLWTGATSPHGYGLLVINPGLPAKGKAHRLSYELLVGPIPAGLVIDHLCQVKGCVNPSHLEAVTQYVNILRASNNLATLNAAKTHCPHGHEFTPDNLDASRVPDGKKPFRKCRACRRDRARRKREAARPVVIAPATPETP